MPPAVAAARPGRARLALALLLLVQLLGLIGLGRIHFDNAPELYFPEHSPAARLERELRARFPGDQSLVALFGGEGLYEAATLAALEGVARRLEAEPRVERVYAVTRQMRFEADALGLTLRPLLDPAADPAARRAALLADRYAPGWLASRDGRLLALMVRPRPLQGSAGRAALEGAFYAAVAAEGLAERLRGVSGLVALDTAEMRSILRDTALFTPPVVLLGLALLGWIVGRARPVAIAALAMGTVVLGVLALLAVSGRPYTLVTAMLPTLLAAYTAANLLHLYAQVQRLAAGGPASPVVAEAVRQLRRPALFNALSTAAGLASLLLVPIPPVQDFALLAAAGALFIYLTVFHLVPPLLEQWDRRPWPAAAGGLAWGRRLACRLAGLSLRRARRVLLLALLLTGATVPLVAQVEVETDLLAFFAKEHPLTRATELVEGSLVGLTALEVVADAPAPEGFRQIAALRALASVQAFAAGLPEVDRAVSLVDLVTEMNRALRGEGAAGLPGDDRELAQLLLLYDGRDLPELVEGQFRRARILLNVRVHGANAIQRVVDALEAHFATLPAGGLRLQVAGSGRLFSELEQQLVIGQQQSFLGAFAQIFLLLFILFRSLPLAAIGMVPNLAPLWFVFVVMGAAGIWLDTATVLIAGVVLGITVDDTIHFLHAYRQRRARGHPPVFALMRSFRATGRAVVAIALLLTAQFLLLGLSQFRPTAHYGLLAATGLLSGQLLELLLLPALLLAWERWRGGRRGERCAI